MKKNKEKEIQVGSFRSIKGITKGLFEKMKNFSIKDAIKNSTKEDYIAGILAVAIVLILGIILWLIPETRGFITSMNPF